MHTTGTIQELGSARETLPVRVAQILRARLREGVWNESGKLPTEADLCAEFAVSRVTIRQALKLLESQGLVESRQGVGTFLTGTNAMVHAGLQELKSITETIKEMGFEPSMEYQSKLIRDADPTDVKDFGAAPNSRILALRRTFHADGAVVAYSEDTMPVWALGPGFTIDQLTGSVFAYLATNTDVRPRKAIAEVHARSSLPATWDESGSEVLHDQNTMYLLLDQLQFDDRNRPFMRTRAHFVEGKFSFVVLRLA